MNDFTKIKLINELIDVVERFYDLKHSGMLKDADHLKGFCEGMAYTLISLEYVTQEEANKILKGVGKRRVAEEKETESEEVIESPTLYQSEDQEENLDIPTFLRKQK